MIIVVEENDDADVYRMPWLFEEKVEEKREKYCKWW